MAGRGPKHKGFPYVLGPEIRKIQGDSGNPGNSGESQWILGNPGEIRGKKYLIIILILVSTTTAYSQKIGYEFRTNGKAYIFGSGIGLEFQEMVNEVVETVHSLTGIKSDIVRVPFPVDEKKMDVGDFVGIFPLALSAWAGIYILNVVYTARIQKMWSP